MRRAGMDGPLGRARSRVARAHASARALHVVVVGAVSIALSAGCRGRLPADDAWCEGDGPPCVEAPDGGPAPAPRPRNIVLFIGDGMGVEQVRAARMFQNGDTELLGFEALGISACVQTENASGTVTDSAAAATAMATGHKVDNGILSLATPGDGAPMTTALEILQGMGKSTGLVTTATRATDATPAAFGAHVSSRYDHDAIAEALMTVSRPDVLMGRPSDALDDAATLAAGYATATTAAGLEEVLAAAPARLSGMFADDEVSLAERTRAALTLLLRDEDGFFLLVEHEGTDNGGHHNDLGEIVTAVLELDAAVTMAREMVDATTTLLMVTADHETGALSLLEESPSAGELPAHVFGTTGHSAADVSLFATGPGSDGIEGCLDNTEIFQLLTDVE